MSEHYRQPGLTPRPTPPPPPPVKLTLTGRILYPAGPWGSNRPVRHRAQLVVWEGQIFDPTRIDPSRRRPAGPSELAQIASGNRIPIGNVGDFYRGRSKSWASWTGGDGSFRFVTNDIDVYTSGLVLEITDYNFISGGEDIKSCLVSLVPGNIELITPAGSIPYSSQSAGNPIRVPWWPPKFMTHLALVNGTAFVDTQKLAAQMASMVRTPSYPAKITLHRESELDQHNVKGEDYSYGQLLFDEPSRGQLAPGFPARVAAEVTKIGRLNVRGSSTAETIAMVLDRLVTINIDQLEDTKSLLNDLINALDTARGGFHKYDVPLADAPQDMAAAIAMLGVAGLMARDNAKPTVNFGFTDLSNSQKMLKVEISVAKK
jgi:hypothetical protein